MLGNEINVQITKNVREANCITHSGKFHADEIFATIILSKVLDKINLARVNEITITTKEGTVVYDIGGGEYDHHQLGGNGRRDNGVKYAACGLIWKNFGKVMLKKYNISEEKINELYGQIDKDLIQYIDSDDNGESPRIATEYKFVHLASIISAFNPSWNEDVDTDECFYEALKLANNYFNNFMKKEIAKIQAKDQVNLAIDEAKDGIMILKQFMPWEEFLLDSKSQKAGNINFVVFPSNRGGFNVHAVPKEIGTFENKKDLPHEWAGLRDEEFQKVSGVKTARFCHNACFICAAETQEDAIKLANIANSKIYKA